ncbi:MAG: sugar O-acyltransferase (sialic acid O-acetyltransferase NeuD family) [Algoriphagus sp.]|jgi:sugar O-acyltransferase (sialic acid O-acetyltransferase NeuD family)
MDNPVIIFGAGTLGKTALDIFHENGVMMYGFLDDKEQLHHTEIGTVMVLGSTDNDDILKIIGNKTEAFVALKNKLDRKKVAIMLQEKRKTMPINAIHKAAIVSEEAVIGHGNLISAGSVIGPFSKIGNLNILGSSVSIDTEAEVGDYVEIGSGSNINSKAKIEEGAFLGSNVTVVSGITIGKNARVGAGSVVIENVAENTTVFGNPAKKM